MPVTNVHPLNQLLGLIGKSADVTRGYRLVCGQCTIGAIGRTKQSIILISQHCMLPTPSGFETIAL